MMCEAIEYEEGTAMLREIEKEEKRPIKPKSLTRREQAPESSDHSVGAWL